ncbi:MAG: 30S ribosomal protein S18 [Candidatus Omnitrophica bacterium]|nr:30S ribosomal protein S18 [Candidatus Omnitrophota bacterium]
MFIKKKVEKKGRGRGGRGDRKGPLKKRVFRRKPCKFCMDKVESISYLDYQRFQKFLTERGKIVPSRITGTCAKHQRQLAKAIRRARVAALLPFVAD